MEWWLELVRWWWLGLCGSDGGGWGGGGWGGGYGGHIMSRPLREA